MLITQAGMLTATESAPVVSVLPPPGCRLLLGCMSLVPISALLLSLLPGHPILPSSNVLVYGPPRRVCVLHGESFVES